MLAADFLHLEKDVETVNRHADLFHLDVMDGIFVPNISFGFPVIEAIASKATKPLDVHLMIVEPERYVERFAKVGAEMISFHLNATKDHLKSNVPKGTRDTSVRMSHEEMGIFRDAFPNKTDAEILALYKQTKD